MIARLEVTRGALTEYPLAERTRGGWQNGVTFYADADVTKVTELEVNTAGTRERLTRAVAVLSWQPAHDGDDPSRVRGDYMHRAQLADEALAILTATPTRAQEDDS